MLEAATKDRKSDARPVCATEEGLVHEAVEQNGNAISFDELCKISLVSKRPKNEKKEEFGKTQNSREGIGEELSNTKMDSKG